MCAWSLWIGEIAYDTQRSRFGLWLITPAVAVAAPGGSHDDAEKRSTLIG